MTLPSGALLLRLGLFLLLGWGGSLMVLQLLLGQRLDRAQMHQLGRDLASSIRLSEMSLERFPPSAVAQLSGLRLLVGTPPVHSKQANLKRRGREVRLELCIRLQHCPEVIATPDPIDGVWVELLSPLERVWMFAPLPDDDWWPPDPLLASLSLLSGTILAAGLFLLLEVQRPLQQLERALGRVGLEQRPAPLPQSGAIEVRRLSQRFNSMLRRLERSEQERATMLAGIAHDLKSPITRLRLRLAVESASRQAEADLDALERITGQFLLFAGGGQGEAPLLLPLQELIGELAARYHDQPVELQLQPIEARVQPVALGRAIANLVDNALSYGNPPVLITLDHRGDELLISVADQGDGIKQAQRDQALMPFQRLDASRGGSGHCGLGLAIASRVAEAHGGRLELHDPAAGGFAVWLLLPKDHLG
jgi:two-component system osmolarity sensor histidine kinase EnvZ